MPSSTSNPPRNKKFGYFRLLENERGGDPYGDGRTWEREDSEVRMEIDAVRNAEDVALRSPPRFVMLCYATLCYVMDSVVPLARSAKFEFGYIFGLRYPSNFVPLTAR